MSPCTEKCTGLFLPVSVMETLLNSENGDKKGLTGSRKGLSRVKYSVDKGEQHRNANAEGE